MKKNKKIILGVLAVSVVIVVTVFATRMLTQQGKGQIIIPENANLAFDYSTGSIFDINSDYIVSRNSINDGQEFAYAFDNHTSLATFGDSYNNKFAIINIETNEVIYETDSKSAIYPLYVKGEVAYFIEKNYETGIEQVLTFDGNLKNSNQNYDFSIENLNDSLTIGDDVYFSLYVPEEQQDYLIEYSTGKVVESAEFINNIYDNNQLCYFKNGEDICGTFENDTSDVIVVDNYLIIMKEDASYELYDKNLQKVIKTGSRFKSYTYENNTINIIESE